MLNLDKDNVDFLVTAHMVDEVRHVLGDVFPRIEAEVLPEMRRRGIDTLYFVACGSPLCACQTAQRMLVSLSSLRSGAFSGMDFLCEPPHVLGRNTLVIGVSDSGRTQEVCDSLALARRRGAMTVAVTKTAENPLADAAEFLVDYHADCIWEVHLLIAYCLALRAMQEAGVEGLEPIMEDMQRLPEVLARLVNDVEEDMKALGERASKWDLIYTVSAGNLLPLGYKEGVITMLEFTWTHGCSLNASEFRHGPLEVVEEDVPYVFLMGNDASRPVTERSLRFVERHSKNVVVFDVRDFEGGLHPALDPMVLFVPLEFFYYYLSVYKDHNPDGRRYYGGLAEY